MLLKYDVSNFESVENNVEFTMLPLKETNNRFLTQIETGAWVFKVLKRSILLGSTAFEKMYFLNSLMYARDCVVNNDIKQLDGQDVATFQFTIYVESKVYYYGFSLKNRCIQEEWLMVMSDNGLFDVLFDTKTNQLSSNNLCNNSRELKLIESVLEDFEERQTNSLFLYRLSQKYNFTIANAVRSWFNDITIIRRKDENYTILIDRMNKQQQGVFVMDELDWDVYKHFLECDPNKQLLCATCNPDFLNLKDFCQEEVWFVSNYAQGKTQIKPFSNFDLREGQDLVKGYLAGRYTPIIPFNSDDSAYNALVQAVDEIRPYYDVNKIKTWAVYIWTKETDEDTGENVFDIQEDEIVFYNKEHIIPDEVIPIIKNIQLKLKALKQIRRFKKERVVIWQ